MITVHYLENSRAQRIIWLLEELGLDYDLKYYERDPQTLLAPESLKAVHPLGKSPVVTAGDVTVAESGAIIEYLIETYGQGRLVPTTPENQRQYHYWLHYAEGSLMPWLVMKLVFNRIPKSPDMPFFLRPVAKVIMDRVQTQFLDPQLSTHLDFIEANLQSQDWFAGDFSAADIQMSFPLEAASNRVDLAAYPQIQAFMKRFQNRPAYQRAISKGGDLEPLD
ncbi:glutathione S-transferase [filamentous cyanobacterium CCP5]|nr:glutathione S-transferase [filamentous cyanobacterium CCP5]